MKNWFVDGIIFISNTQNFLAATMKYGLGSNDPEELAYYNKIREEMDEIKKRQLKKESHLDGINK